MWQCLKCGESVEDGFDTCSNCGAGADATVNPYAYQEPGEVAPGDNRVAVEVVDEGSNYWGPWATVGLSLAVASLYLIANTAVVVVMIIARGSLDAIDGVALENNGLLLSIASIVSAPFAIGPILLFVYLRRGASIRQYLALHPVAPRSLAFWLAATGLLIVAGDALTHVMGRDIVPEFMYDVWRTAAWLPLLWVTLIVMAPLVEETFFRGFLFVGLRHSRIGDIGAILITSAVWAAIHMQYDFYQISTIFVGGIVLGVARIRTNSLYVPMAMHSLMNVVATLEAAWVMR